MNGLISFLLFAGLFYFMMRYGCGAHVVHGHGGGCVGKEKSIDPVCGMQVDPQQGYSKMFRGTQYRFCSRNCLDRFDAEPVRYLESSPGNAEDGEK